MDRSDGAGTRGDVKFVEEESKHPGARLTRRPFFLGFGLNRVQRTGGLGKGPELHALKRTRDTVFQEFKIRGPQIENRPAIRIGDDGIEADRDDVRGARRRRRLLRVTDTAPQHERRYQRQS